MKDLSANATKAGKNIFIHEGHEGTRSQMKEISAREDQEETRRQDKDIPLRDEVYAIVGAAIEVHRELGPGFLEAVYQEAIAIELTERAIPFENQKLLPIRYKGRFLSKEYVADIVCFGAIIVELKALDKLSGKEGAQLLNYSSVKYYL